MVLERKPANKVKAIPRGIECLEKVLELEPEYHCALRGKIEALFKLDQYSDVLQFYQRLVELSPESVYDQFIEGILLSYLGRCLEAIEEMKKAMRYTMFHDPTLLLSYLRYKIGGVEMAKPDFRAIKTVSARLTTSSKH